MSELWGRLIHAIRAPFERLWRRPWMRRTVAFLHNIGLLLTEPVMGGLLDEMTLNDAKPFRRTRAWMKYVWRQAAENEQAVKIRISAMLVLTAGILTAIHPQKPMALVCAGIGFSFFGDAMIMQYPPIRGMVRQYFLWGMGCFAVAQILYQRAMLGLYLRAGSTAMWPVWIMVAAFCLLALILLCARVLFRPNQPLALRIGALVYALLLASMTGSTAAACIATAGRGWPLLAGGLLFMISDLLIALTYLGGVHLEHKEFWIWVTYVPAQLLLIFGTAALS